jgi:hypothetical protein
MQAYKAAGSAFLRSLEDAAVSAAATPASAGGSRSTPGAASVRTSRTVPGADSGGGAKPFVPGNSREAAQTIDEIMARARGWEAYFISHAPGEWFRDAESRAAFAEIYGEKALVTLDWTLTVPVNRDPVWVTRVEVDDSGIPIPHAPRISESSL